VLQTLQSVADKKVVCLQQLHSTGGVGYRLSVADVADYSYIKYNNIVIV